jgi:hypothetical protein
VTRHHVCFDTDTTEPAMAPLFTESRRQATEFVTVPLHLQNMQDDIRLKPRLLSWNALNFEGIVNSHPKELC